MDMNSKINQKEIFKRRFDIGKVFSGLLEW